MIERLSQLSAANFHTNANGSNSQQHHSHHAQLQQHHHPQVPVFQHDEDLAMVNTFLLSLGDSIASSGSNHSSSAHSASSYHPPQTTYFDPATLAQLGLAGLPGIPSPTASTPSSAGEPFAYNYPFNQQRRGSGGPSQPSGHGMDYTSSMFPSLNIPYSHSHSGDIKREQTSSPSYPPTRNPLPPSQLAPIDLMGRKSRSVIPLKESVVALQRPSTATSSSDRMEFEESNERGISGGESDEEMEEASQAPPPPEPMEPKLLPPPTSSATQRRADPFLLAPFRQSPSAPRQTSLPPSADKEKDPLYPLLIRGDRTDPGLKLPPLYRSRDRSVSLTPSSPRSTPYSLSSSGSPTPKSNPSPLPSFASIMHTRSRSPPKVVNEKERMKHIEIVRNLLVWVNEQYMRRRDAPRRFEGRPDAEMIEV
jgi:hypothetical protein